MRRSYHPPESVTTYRKALPQRGAMTIGCAMPPFETTEELPAIAAPRRAPLPTPVVQPEIRHSRFLDPKANAVRPLPDFTRPRAALLPLYPPMLLARRLPPQ